MSNINAKPQDKVPGFWTRLAIALEPLGGSYQEQLERRVRRLETEVARLSGRQERLAKS